MNKNRYNYYPLLLSSQASIKTSKQTGNEHQTTEICSSFLFFFLDDRCNRNSFVAFALFIIYRGNGNGPLILYHVNYRLGQIRLQ